MILSDEEVAELREYLEQKHNERKAQIEQYEQLEEMEHRGQLLEQRGQRGQEVPPGQDCRAKKIRPIIEKRRLLTDSNGLKRTAPRA